MHHTNQIIHFTGHAKQSAGPAALLQQRLHYRFQRDYLQHQTALLHSICACVQLGGAARAGGYGQQQLDEGPCREAVVVW